MESMQGKEYVPMNMRSLVMRSLFPYLPLLISEQTLSPKYEIAASLAGYVIGPFLALVPLSYRLRFVLGSLLGLLPLVLLSFPLVRAFILGLLVSYYKMVADLFFGALCLKTKKAAVLVLENLVVAWISFGTFFSLRFCPILTTIATSWVFVLLSALATAAFSYLYTIETPEEIIERLKREKTKSAAYEDLYRTLLYLNGPGATDSEEFQQEYKEILDKRKNLPSDDSLRAKSAAIAVGVNVSFIYIAFQRTMGVNGTYSLYRIFLGAMNLFSWSFKYASGTSSLISILLPVVALYFICVSTGRYQDLGLVLLMVLGIEAMPAHPSLYRLHPFDRALIASLQNLMALICFLLLTAYIAY